MKFLIAALSVAVLALPSCSKEEVKPSAAETKPAAAAEKKPETAAKSSTAEFPDITLQELKSAIAGKQVTILDNNGATAYNDGHIPGALHYPQVAGNALAEKLPADKGALIVAYCGNSKCQAYKEAAEAAKKLGYTNVRHFSEGRAGWIAANEPVEKK